MQYLFHLASYVGQCVCFLWVMLGIGLVCLLGELYWAVHLSVSLCDLWWELGLSVG